VLTVLGHLFQIIQGNPVLRVLAGAAIALAVALGVATAAGAAFDAVMAIDPITLIIMAIIALVAGLYLLYKHCALVRQIVADVANFFKAAWHEAMKLAGAAIQWFVNGPLKWIKEQIAVFTTWWNAHYH